MKPILSIFRLTVAFLLAVVSFLPLEEQVHGQDSTITPMPRDGWHMERHKKFNERAKQGDVDLVFIGDSITQDWEGNGQAVWKKFYGNRKPMNLGISGDRTEHVLWRLDNGNIDGINPKLVVMMIGTNNISAGNTAEDIAAGIETIVQLLHKKLPETKILVLGIFPRDETPNQNREKIAAINKQIKALADNRSIDYLDIGSKFLRDDGKLSKDIMPDFLHLSPTGYEIWAEAIEPNVAKIIGNSH